MIQFDEPCTILFWGTEAVQQKNNIEGYLRKAWDGQVHKQLQLVSVEDYRLAPDAIANAMLNHLGEARHVNLQIIMGDLSRDISLSALKNWMPNGGIPSEVGGLFEGITQIEENLGFVSLRVQMVWLLQGSGDRSLRFQHMMARTLAEKGDAWVVVALENHYANGAIAPTDAVAGTLYATVAVLPTAALTLRPGELYSAGYQEINQGDQELKQLRQHELASRIFMLGEDASQPQELTLWRFLFAKTAVEGLVAADEDAIHTLFLRIAEENLPLGKEMREQNRRLFSLYADKNFDACEKAVSSFYRLNVQMAKQRIDDLLSQLRTGAQTAMQGCVYYGAFRRFFAKGSGVQTALVRLSERGGITPTLPQERRGMLARVVGIADRQINEYCEEYEQAYASYARDLLTQYLANGILKLLESLNRTELARMQARHEGWEKFFLSQADADGLKRKYSQYDNHIQSALSSFAPLLEKVTFSLQQGDREIHTVLAQALQACTQWLETQNSVFAKSYCDYLLTAEITEAEQLRLFIDQYLSSSRRLFRTALPVDSGEAVYLADDTANWQLEMGRNWLFPDTDNIARLDVAGICSMKTIKTAGESIPSMRLREIFGEDAKQDEHMETGEPKQEESPQLNAQGDMEGKGQPIASESKLNMIRCVDGNFLIQWYWPAAASSAATICLGSTKDNCKQFACTQTLYENCGGGMKVNKSDVPFGRAFIEVRYANDIQLSAEVSGRKHIVQYNLQGKKLMLEAADSSYFNKIMGRTGNAYFLFKASDAARRNATWENVRIDEVLPLPKQRDILEIKRMNHSKL